MPGKKEVFILDFANDVGTIKKAFDDYYTTTILAEETDPNKLNDLKSELETHQIYTDYHIEKIVELYLSGAERDTLDPILDACANSYKSLDEDGQVSFKGNAKAFVRTYGFLGAILNVGKVEWEKLALFLNLLIPKLPSPVEDDLSQGILDAIDLESYRAEVKETINIYMDEAPEHEVGPVPTGQAGGIVDPDMELLSIILQSFHELFGNIDWTDEDQVKRHIAGIPAVVSKDKAYQNAMKNSDKQNARIESERALRDAVLNMISDNMELYKQFNDNQSFKKWLSDMVFSITYNTEGKPFTGEVDIK
jgi:type I restriction enzyme R subunit